MSQLRAEIFESEQRLRDLFTTEQAGLERLKSVDPSVVVTAARGTSNAAAVYLHYLIKKHLGKAAFSIRLSDYSVFDMDWTIKDALAIFISQSGESGDLLKACDYYNQAGVTTLALTNSVDSRLAHKAEIMLDQKAGEELSVAATKSFICSIGISLLVAEALSGVDLKPDEDMLKTLFEGREAADLSPLHNWKSVLCVGRGASLGTAKEAALKMKEVCWIHAEAYSLAEVMHGPKALIVKGFPVLAFMPGGGADESFNTKLDELRAIGAHVIVFPALEGVPSHLWPLTHIFSFYQGLLDLAESFSIDVDEARNLMKVTHTL